MATDTGLDTPTLRELLTRIRGDLESGLPGEGAQIRRSLLYVLGGVMGGAIFEVYGHLERLAKNVVIDRIEDPDVLRRIAAVWGITADPGTQATGIVELSGTPTTAVPAGTVIERASGWQYTTDALATIGGGGTVTVAITSVDPGVGGNVDDATETLTIPTPISGVSSTVAIDTEPAGGIDPESDASLQTRLVERIRSVPQGGAAVDYVAWTKAAPGVSAEVARVWVDPGFSAEGEVLVYFALDGSGSAVIPSGGDVAAVQAYIDEEDATGHAIRRPVTALVTVYAPTADPIAFTIGLSPNNATTRALVGAELETMFSTEAIVRLPPYQTGVIRNAKIHEALVRTLSQGVSYYRLDSVDGGAATLDITPNAVGALPVLGTVTFVSL